MKDDIKQLADIMVDWCGHDLEQITAHPASIVAEEFLRCVLFTMTQEPEALRILNKLIAQERREWLAAHPE
jgi:hypothetical protein